MKPYRKHSPPSMGEPARRVRKPAKKSKNVPQWTQAATLFSLLPCADEEVRTALHAWRKQCAEQNSAELEVRFVIERVDGKPCIRALVRATKVISEQRMMLPWKGPVVVQLHPSIKEQQYVLEHRFGAEHL